MTPAERATMSMVATTRILHRPTGRQVFGRHSSWVWPLPRLDGSAPSILASSGAVLADGSEIGYRSRSLSRSLIPVFAAQDGVVTYAINAASGSTLCIDHADGWSTSYMELEQVLMRPTDRFRRRRKERVRTGDVVGHARRSALRIRFALFRLTDEGCSAQDPAMWLSGWSLLPWFEDCPAAVALPGDRAPHAGAA
jgi:hypothetical protein